MGDLKIRERLMGKGGGRMRFERLLCASICVLKGVVCQTKLPPADVREKTVCIIYIYRKAVIGLYMILLGGVLGLYMILFSAYRSIYDPTKTISLILLALSVFVVNYIIILMGYRWWFFRLNNGEIRHI